MHILKDLSIIIPEMINAEIWLRKNFNLFNLPSLLICFSELGRIRSRLVDIESYDVIGLLHYLRKMNVLNDKEEKTVERNATREDKARCLIDTVMEKGEGESSLMVDYLMERHHELRSNLRLTPTSARISEL